MRRLKQLVRFDAQIGNMITPFILLPSSYANTECSRTPCLQPAVTPKSKPEIPAFREARKQLLLEMAGTFRWRAEQPDCLRPKVRK